MTVKNILSFAEGTPILGSDIKKWIAYHIENETSHTKIARGLVRYFNISDTDLYTVNLRPSGTGSGEIGRLPTIERCEPFVPKKASDYTVEEKVALFDKMLTGVTEAYSDMMAGEEDEDTKHYIYEEAMGWLGSGVWKAVNNRRR